MDKLKRESANEVPPNRGFKDFLNADTNYSMYFKPITEQEVKKFCNEIRTSAIGFDGLSPLILKRSIDIISKPLTYLVNLSFKTGVFPEDLKIAKVIAIHKSGDKDDIKNKRPISILNVISKIFEKAIHNRLNTYLEKHQLIVPNQHGFRQNHSTESAIISFTKPIYEALNKHEYAIGVFLDFSKAFDCIDHDILVTKLENLDMRGSFLLLLSDYLANRKQTVYYQGNFSDLKTLRYGVPQGSILGPLMFNIYVNDVRNASNILHITLYADDKNCGMTHENPYILVRNLNLELKLIYEWILCNHLILNFLKNAFILFSRSNFYGPLPPLLIGGKIISRVHSSKFLGVILDDKLSWECHISNLCSKLSKLCGIMYITRKKLSKAALINIYYCLFYSNLSYCITLWGGATSKNINMLYMVQKRFIRAITFTRKFERITPIFNSMRILKLCFIYKLFMFVLGFKYYYQRYCSQVFEINQNAYGTRRANTLLKIPGTTCAAGSQSIHYKLPSKWNEFMNSPLSNVILNSNSLNSFKKSFKIILFNEQV